MSDKLVWAIAILLLLFLFIYSKFSKFGKGRLWKFNWWRKWKPNEVLFGIFWDTFIATIAIVVALKLANINGAAIAMFYFLIFSIVCLAFAIVIRIRIDAERDNAPLDVGKINADFRRLIEKKLRKIDKQMKRK